MEAHKCDRCGKYVDTSDIPQIRGWGSETARTIGTPRISMELCPECFEALKEFLSNKNEEKICCDCKYADRKMTEPPCNSCDLSYSNYIDKKGEEDGSTK